MEKEEKQREARGGIERHEIQQEDPASQDDSRQVKLSPDVDVERGCDGGDHVDVEVGGGCGTGLEEDSEPGQGRRAMCQILEVNSKLGEPGRLGCQLREISQDELSHPVWAEVGQGPAEGQPAHCELRHWAVLTILLTIVILSLLKLFLTWLGQGGQRTEVDPVSQHVLQSTRTV